MSYFSLILVDVPKSSLIIQMQMKESLLHDIHCNASIEHSDKTV